MDFTLLKAHYVPDSSDSYESRGLVASHLRTIAIVEMITFATRYPTTKIGGHSVTLSPFAKYLGISSNCNLTEVVPHTSELFGPTGSI